MYFFILIVLRVTTRRILRSATPLDLVVIFLFGGFTLPSLLVNDQSMTGALIGLSTVAGLHFGLSRLRTHFPVVGRLTEGTPVTIYAGQNFDHNQMWRSRVTMADVESEMRTSGITSIADVDRVVIEHNGGISILVRD